MKKTNHLVLRYMYGEKENPLEYKAVETALYIPACEAKSEQEAFDAAFELANRYKAAQLNCKDLEIYIEESDDPCQIVLWNKAHAQALAGWQVISFTDSEMKEEEEKLAVQVNTALYEKIAAENRAFVESLSSIEDAVSASCEITLRKDLLNLLEDDIDSEAAIGLLRCQDAAEAFIHAMECEDYSDYNERIRIVLEYTGTDPEMVRYAPVPCDPEKEAAFVACRTDGIHDAVFAVCEEAVKHMIKNNMCVKEAATVAVTPDALRNICGTFSVYASACIPVTEAVYRHAISQSIAENWDLIAPAIENGKLSWKADYIAEIADVICAALENPCYPYFGSEGKICYRCADKCVWCKYN